MLADFSIAMGALIAGVTLSAFPYSLDVVAKIRSLRDFFVTLFFVALGMQLQIGSLQVVLIALALSAFVVPSVSLSNSAMLTTFLTHGFLLAALVVYLMPAESTPAKAEPKAPPEPELAGERDGMLGPQPPQPREHSSGEIPIQPATRSEDTQ
jgi:hypothetical protein